MERFARPARRMSVSSSWDARNRIREELAKFSDWHKLPIRIVHASEVVTMEDNATKALRHKRDSSIRVAARLVRDGTGAGAGFGGQHRRGDGYHQNAAGA